jgi:large subunit ribosomal protein L14e
MVGTRFVEIGRVVYINYGPDLGKLAVIVDIVDYNRAIVDGPSTGVARQQLPLKRASLTEFVIPLKRNQTSKSVAKAFAEASIAEKWAETNTGKTQAARLRKASLTDFERFKVMLAQQKKSLLVRQELRKLKKTK